MPLTQTSFSGIQKFAACPRAWYLAEFLGLQPIDAERVGPLPFGSRLHLALEIWNKSHWQQEITSIWRTIENREREVFDSLGYVWSDEAQKENRMGHAMLEGFADWMEEEGILADWEVIGVEVKYGMTVPITMHDGRTVDVVLRSKVDTKERDRRSGALYVQDYKSTSSLTEDSTEVTMSKMQGPLYVKQVRVAEPDEHVEGVIYTMLRKVLRGPRSKPPYYARLVDPLSESRIQATMSNARAQISRMAAVQDALETGARHSDVTPYQISWECKSCPFRRPCEMMRDGRMSGANAMLRGEFRRGDPLARYTEVDPLLLV